MSNKIWPLFFALLLLLSNSGCTLDAQSQQSVPDSIMADDLQQIDTPASAPSAEPKLVRSTDGRVFLSWIQHNATGPATLHAAQFLNGIWTESLEIASGENWFINWADFPALAVHENGMMAASFLEKSGQSTYAYDVKLTTSKNHGASWQQAFKAHLDNTQTEHGFVSLLPWQSDQFMAIWLDGRNTGAGGHDGHGRGAMTLRAARFDSDGQLYDQVELDDRICDCCQTSAIQTGPGRVLVAYRNRSEEEIRDIAVVRLKNGAWSAPEVVHNDDWKIPGCPVNGPALAGHEDQVALGWFTAANNLPAVYASFSDSNGDSFSAPVKIDEGNPAGRVGVTFLEENLFVVSWLERKSQTAAAINLRVVEKKSRGEMFVSDPILLIETAPTRQSGFPQMQSTDKHLVFAWTDVSEKDASVVRSAFAPKSWLTSFARKPAN